MRILSVGIVRAGDDSCNNAMIVRWVASPFDVPILDAAYDVARVSRTQHEFHFEAGVVFTVGKQHVNSSAAALDSFTLKHIQLSKP